MKTNDIITAAELSALVASHGAGTISVDGSMPEAFVNGEDLGIETGDRFTVVVNYGHAVQFHLVSDEMRAIITTGLKGRCDDMDGWVAAL